MFLKCLLASRLTLFRLSTFLWPGSCTHRNFAASFHKKSRHSSSNHGLLCLSSCGTRLSLAKILIISLMFSHALFISPSSLMFPNAANLFVISIWYCFLTSRSFSFLRLNLSSSSFCAACLLTANLSLNLQPPDSDQYHNQLPWSYVHLVSSTVVSYISICGLSDCASSHQERSRCAYECLCVGTSCS